MFLSLVVGRLLGLAFGRNWLVGVATMTVLSFDGMSVATMN
jgi:hypothetical protein